MCQTRQWCLSSSASHVWQHGAAADTAAVGKDILAPQSVEIGPATVNMSQISSSSPTPRSPHALCPHYTSLSHSLTYSTLPRLYSTFLPRPLPSRLSLFTSYPRFPPYVFLSSSLSLSFFPRYFLFISPPLSSSLPFLLPFVRTPQGSGMCAMW